MHDKNNELQTLFLKNHIKSILSNNNLNEEQKDKAKKEFIKTYYNKWRSETNSLEHTWNQETKPPAVWADNYNVHMPDNIKKIAKNEKSVGSILETPIYTYPIERPVLKEAKETRSTQEAKKEVGKGPEPYERVYADKKEFDKADRKYKDSLNHYKFAKRDLDTMLEINKDNIKSIEETSYINPVLADSKIKPIGSTIIHLKNKIGENVYSLQNDLYKKPLEIPVYRPAKLAVEVPIIEEVKKTEHKAEVKKAKEKISGPVKYKTSDGAGHEYYFIMDSVGGGSKSVRAEEYDSLKYTEVKWEDLKK